MGLKYEPASEPLHILASIPKQETLYAKMLEGWEKKMGEELTPNP